VVQKADSLKRRHAGLANRIARWTGDKNRLDTAVQGLSLHRWEAPTEPRSYLLAPSICLIGQGRKRVLLGEEAYVYDAHHFLINSVDLPLVAQIIEASIDRPYLGLTLELDLRAIARLMLASNLPSPRTNNDRIGIAVSQVSLPLLDAFERLIDLLKQPEDIPVLAPLIQREIFYRLLVSEQGPRLRQITSVESHSYQIAQAIDWLKDNFDKTFRVEDLATKAGISTSTFHHRFRSMTAMSPLQFQKRLRLNEARQPMLTENLDAATAAFQVGYESPSQFSREYSRLFGAPPLRDITNLRELAGGATV
jgi:AraC-like DNA-binding protein